MEGTENTHSSESRGAITKSLVELLVGQLICEAIARAPHLAPSAALSSEANAASVDKLQAVQEQEIGLEEEEEEEEDCDRAKAGGISIFTCDSDHRWPSWVQIALNEGNSEDDVLLWGRQLKAPKRYFDCSSQTEQPAVVRRPREEPGAGDAAELAPCELTRQTLFLATTAMVPPPVARRPPLADRLFYMLTDFASALYCSIAIMCCCTPNMFQ